jgi:2'-5' RNA ligase
VRLFLGIPLGESRAQIARAVDVARGVVPQWAGEKWVAEQNLHCTLVFLGDVPESDVDGVCEVAGRLTNAAKRPDLHDGRLRAVPSTRKASMVWLHYADSDLLCTQFAQTLAAELVGSVDARKPFTPHATLVRARRPRPAGAFLECLETELLAGARSVSDPVVSLYESRLTPRGPVYTVIETWTFNGG